MTIQRIDSGLPTTTKIELLNDQILEVNGKAAQSQFSKNETAQIYNDLDLVAQYTRDYAVGNTVATHTGWTHVKAETGYSIWKYLISDYKYNANNQLYFDDKLVSFKGLATSETATVFDSVFVFDSPSFTDVTTEASTEEGTEFSALSTTADYIYCGHSTTFGGLKIEFQTRAAGATFKVEYYNGAWTELLTTADNLNDTTLSGVSDGSITWDIPSGWTTTSVNSTTKYWIRISTTTVPSSAPEIYYLIPTDSVVGLLAMSSEQLLDEEWMWCSLGTTIYVTIRNAGNSAYEGDYFLTSSSTAARKETFFVYNHEFKLDYETSVYYDTEITASSGVTYGDMVYISEEYTVSSADADSFAYRAVGVLDYPGKIKYISGLVRNVNTVGSSDIVPGDILYLSSTPGKVTRTAPSGAGKIQQKVGTAISYESSGNVVDIVMHIDSYPTIL